MADPKNGGDPPATPPPAAAPTVDTDSIVAEVLKKISEQKPEPAAAPAPAATEKPLTLREVEDLWEKKVKAAVDALPAPPAAPPAAAPTEETPKPKAPWLRRVLWGDE